jgi:enamine deaminase RidA (YjgF/YER057c/UK114 family)
MNAVWDAWVPEGHAPARACVTAKMAPVLSALKDNSLFLKHNLNAKAVGALQGEMGSIKRDVSVLIKDMNLAIEQSQKFIDMLEN